MSEVETLRDLANQVNAIGRALGDLTILRLTSKQTGQLRAAQDLAGHLVQDIRNLAADVEKW